MELLTYLLLLWMKSKYLKTAIAQQQRLPLEAGVSKNRLRRKGENIFGQYSAMAALPMCTSGLYTLKNQGPPQAHWLTRFHMPNMANADIKQSARLIVCLFIVLGILEKISRTIPRSPFIKRVFFLSSVAGIS